jgi:GTPase
MLAEPNATDPVRAGFCAIIGFPNVGKSTLLNRMLGTHLAAVSGKPQTTRDRILGVHHIDEGVGDPALPAQIAFIDTPGMQDGQGPLRRYMRDEAVAAASECDVVLLVIDASDYKGRVPERLAEQDAALIAQAMRQHPCLVALNKVDKVGKPELLPLIESWAKVASTGVVVPICASTGDNVDQLATAIALQLPVGPALFPSDMVTDRPERFVAAEIIREQLYHQLGKELPYACAVQIESWAERAHHKDVAISAVIVVERETQKAIVVGRAGSRIRELGIAARQALSASIGRPVHLKLFVKVVEEWSRMDASLRKLGYGGGSGK